MTGGGNQVSSAEDEHRFADFHEQYVSKYIQLADAKAGTVIVAVSVVIGYLFGSKETMAVLHAPGMGWSFGVAFLSILLLTGSAGCAALVVWPRTGGVPHNLIFWERVAAMERQDFLDAVGQAGSADLARERLKHCHAIAATCTRKYRWLRASFVLGGIALVLSGVGRFLAGA